jgi:hypothetical protein
MESVASSHQMSLEIRGFVQLSAAAEKTRETSGKPISMGLACFARRN